MIVTEEKLGQFCIDKFMGKKTSVNTLTDLYIIVDKIEEQHNGSGIPLRTLLTTNETKNIAEKYRFIIYFNQSAKYIEVSSMREACIYKCIIEFCKDWYISQVITKSEEKRSVR